MNKEQLALLLRLVSLSEINRRILESFQSRQITYIRACELLNFNDQDRENLLALDLMGYLSKKLTLSSTGLEVANVCKIRYAELSAGIPLEQRKKFYADEVGASDLLWTYIIQKEDKQIPIFGDGASLFKGDCPFEAARPLIEKSGQGRIDGIKKFGKSSRIDSRPILFQAFDPLSFKLIWFDIAGERPQAIQAKYFDFTNDFYEGMEIQWQYSIGMQLLASLNDKGKILALVSMLNPKHFAVPERLR